MGFGYEKINNKNGNEGGESAPVLERAYQRTQKLFKENQILEEDFIGTFGGEEIRRDQQKKKEKEEKIDKPDKISEILEGIILREGEQSLWFGPNAETIKASRFDDLFNGTDLVLEILEDDEGDSATHFSLGVDATFSSGIHLGEKIDRILTYIENGEMGSVKYFKSERLGFEGRLKDIPRLVIGIERKNVEDLAKRWMERHPREMAQEPTQFVILEEMRLQCEALAQYAHKNGKKKIARKYEKALRTINEIIEEKGDYNLEEMEDDRVFGAIRTEMRKLLELSGGSSQ